MGYREPTPEQEEGSEFAGTVLQNTLPPKPSVKDLSPAEQRRLIVTTGQDTDPAATARQRHMYGQTGPDPEAPPPPRYMR
jgi:hypothetical protein